MSVKKITNQLFRRSVCYLPVFIFFGLSLNVQAQNSIVRGIITDDEDNRPIEGANIVLINEELDIITGAATDRNGLYRIQNIRPAEYIVRVSYIGYQTLQDTLNIESSESSIIYSASLVADSELLDEVVVSVESEAARISGGYQRVSAADLSRAVTPAAGGDMATYLQALPGVVTAGDRGGQLFVRGGTPSENLSMIDGLTIYQPFHIVGFFSAFPEDLLANADFYAGGFNSRYHGRISSVLDVQMRDGNFNNTRGSVSMSPFLVEAQMEGPVKKGRSSWLASFRSSQIENTSEFLLGEKQPLYFDSQFLKFTQFNEMGTRCSAMFMRTYDRGALDFEMGNSFRWTNFVIGGKCSHLAQDPDIYNEFSFGLSHLSNSLGGTVESNLTSGITKLDTRLNLTQYIGDIQVNYGVHSHMKWLNYDIEELFQVSQQQTELLLGFGGHVEFDIPIIENVSLKPGMASLLYVGTYSPSLEPRFSVSWQPFGNDSQELNASIGIYKQAIAGITDLRDAGSAFMAWIPTPNEVRMGAIHTLLGWRQSFGNGLQFSVEGYHKRLRNLPVTVWSTIAEFTTEIDFADGEVIGADARIEFGSRRLYGFIGYGFSWTKYESAQENFSEWFGTPVQSYHPAHDRRHQLNSMASFQAGKYTFGARWQLGTGLPFTRQMGFDGMQHFDEGLPNVRTRYGTPRVILDKPFRARTPVYHRFDVSVDRIFDLDFAEVELQAGAINSYGRTNLFYFDVFTQRRIDQLPFAPYASIKVDF